MKKLLVMAAGVSVALASCTKNEVDVPQSIGGDKEITFALPVVSPSSRAVAETGTGYAVSGSETQAKYDFGVWAKYYADNATDVKWSAGQFYIGKSDANDHGVTAKYQSDLKGWGFETPYYWPKNGSLSFIAYAPASASTTATVTTNGIQFTDYTVSDNADVDLLFSEITRNQKKDKIDTTDPYHGIQIAFNHALSSIRFKVNTDENYEKTTIKVQKIEILNAYSQGDFNQGLDDTNDATTKEVATHNGWSGHATEKTYTAFTDNVGITLSTTAQYTHSKAQAETANTTDLILLPQSLTHTTTSGDGEEQTTTTTDVKAKVTYTITSPSGNTLNQVSELNLSTTAVSSWERGKRYTYTITFGLDKIYLDPSVTGWNPVSVSGNPEI